MKVAGLSDRGKMRSINQDSIRIVTNDNQHLLMLVCDGIGGGKAGDVASALACETFSADFMKNPSFSDEEEIRQWLNHEISHCNDVIFAQAATSKKYYGMGTTLVGAIVTHDHTYVFNAGDSRAYAIYDELVLLTEDHNLFQELLHSGALNDEEIKRQPKRNVLTNALGIWDKTKVDIFVIKPGYTNLLLCSDGLHAYVDEEKIEDVLCLETSCEDKVKSLIQLGLDAGGYDNISVVLFEKEVSENV